MKESEFIEQNKKKWLEFENNLLKKDGDPATTSKLFVQITDDLSYAQTFYKNRSVRLYLNGTAKLLFNDLNKTHQKGTAAFINFWKKDLPLTVYHARRAMLISFLVFVSCFILGVVTSIHDKEFARMILSNNYVNKTNENIAKGDAMAIYKSESELRTFLPILYNNLKVDFLTFFSGIFMAIGSLVIMVFNGVMVGVFQYFFIERGLFWESFLAIWTHGALEISAIILSGAAGLTLGKGLLFPGTHTRFHAFKLSGMNGLRIIMGVAPITLLAAFIEGFLTRHTEIPDPIRFIFILMSFAFILLYFFIYPRKVARRQLEQEKPVDHTLVYKTEREFDPYAIHSAGKLITETFSLLLKDFIYFGRLIFFFSFLAAVLVSWNPLNLFHEYDNFTFNMDNFFSYNTFPALGIFTFICFAGMVVAYLFFLKRKFFPKRAANSLLQSPHLLKSAASAFLSAFLFVFLIYTEIDFTLVAANILFPLLVFVACISNHEDLSFYDAIGYAGSLFNQSWSKFMVTAIVFVSLTLVIYTTAIYGIKVLFIQDALAWVLTDDETVVAKINLAFNVFQTFLSFFLYITLSVISNSLLYLTLKEAYTAGHLVSRIKNIRINK